jgi:hypothetical protein
MDSASDRDAAAAAARKRRSAVFVPLIFCGIAIAAAAQRAAHVRAVDAVALFGAGLVAGATLVAAILRARGTRGS